MHEIGYVYVLKNNETSHWKIGCTERPLAQRIVELNGVGSGLIGRWELADNYIVEYGEMRAVERSAHRILADLGLRVRLDREVFRGTLNQCHSAILEALRGFPKSMQIYSVNRLADAPAGDGGTPASSFRRVEYRFSRVSGKFFFGVHRVKLDEDGCIEQIDLSPYGFDTSNSHGDYLCDAYRGLASAWTHPPVMWVDVFTADADGSFDSCGLLGDEWGRIQFYSRENLAQAGDHELRQQADEAWQEYRRQSEKLEASCMPINFVKPSGAEYTAERPSIAEYKAERARIVAPVEPANFIRVSDIARSMVSCTWLMTGIDKPYRSDYKR